MVPTHFLDLSKYSLLRGVYGCAPIFPQGMASRPEECVKLMQRKLAAVSRTVSVQNSVQKSVQKNVIS
jgi:hypothetical protein